MPNSDPCLAQAAIETICIAIGDQGPEINRIPDSGSNEPVADDTCKYFVTSRRGTRYVLIVSNGQFPLMVSRAVSRLQDARLVLSSKTRDVAEMPVDHGSWDEVSYALWSYRFPLSGNRLRRFVQKKLVGPKVRAWLSSVALQTQQRDLNTTVIRANFAEPLGTLISHPRLSAGLKTACNITVTRLANGHFRPVHVLQHGDLWLGNVLMKGSLALLNPWEYGFIVIDWGGAMVAGYPFFDLLVFSMSCNTSAKEAARHFDAMRSIIGCAPADVVSFVLCALGKLCQDLEHFPEQRFIHMCEAAIDYLAAAGLRMEDGTGDRIKG